MKRPETVLAALAHRAFRLLSEADALVTTLTDDGASPEDAWNTALVEVRRAAVAHCQHVLLENFLAATAALGGGTAGPADQADPADPAGPVDPAVLAALGQLQALHGLALVEHELGDFLEDGHLDRVQAGWVRAGVRALLGAVEGDAVALVDAFDLADRELKSALGRFDGRVYEALLASAKANPMNTQQDEADFRHHIAPLGLYPVRARL